MKIIHFEFLLNFHFISVLQSFEELVALYAQQLILNETRTFTAPSLVVVAESVSQQISRIRSKQN